MNLDGAAPPLDDMLDDIPRRVAPFGCESMRFVMRKEYELACNWKVYVDNYLEGYHIPVVHPSLHKEIDYDAYRVEPQRYSSIQHAPLRALPPAPAPPTATTIRPRRTLPRPSTAGSFRTSCSTSISGRCRPTPCCRSPTTARVVVFEWFAANPPDDPASDPEWSRLVRFSDEIQDEDIEICETVQRNLRSRVYDRGRYSAKREVGVHHFHSLLHEFLT